MQQKSAGKGKKENRMVTAFENKKRTTTKVVILYGAGDEARTRYLHLGKVALYRMSYTRGTRGIIAQTSILSTPYLEKF